jgi:hypothetical protein
VKPWLAVTEKLRDHKINYGGKGLIVEESRRNQLDAKLKEMIKQFEEAETKRNKPMTQPGTCNAIRRREGEREKRFSF